MGTRERITKVLTGRKYCVSARDIARECGVSTDGELQKVKRLLTKMVKDGTLESKIVKASHHVYIQGKFGGAAMGRHKESRYMLATYIAPGISVQSATTELVSIGPAHPEYRG